MSIIFRRINGRIIPIKTDGARDKGKRGGVGSSIAKASVAAGAAGGAYYVTAQKAHSVFTAAAERLDKWLGKTFVMAQRVASVPKAPIHKAGKRGVLRIEKPVRLKKDGTPYKTRAKKMPVEPLPGQGSLFSDPHVAKPTHTADDLAASAKKMVRKERIGVIASRIGSAAKAGAARLGILKKYSPLAAGAVGLAVGGAVLYNELQQARIIRRRK